MPNGARNWCGTVQLDDETFEVLSWFQRLMADGIIKYAVGQIERGSHVHLQFYLQCAKKMTLDQMKRLVHKGAHWEIARGSVDQCVAYCCKEDTRVAGPWELGEASRAGQRNDLKRAAEMIMQGNALKEIAEECPSTFIRYHRGLQAFRNLTICSKPREFGRDGPEVWVFWGPSGTGKSRRAFERWPDAYVKNTVGKWWDGYEGQETVIFDDFKGSSLTLHDFQQVIDWYKHRVEVKGGFVELSATRYVFTSNKHPSEWYSAEADPEGTVMRRINEFCVDRGRLFHCVTLNEARGLGKARVLGNTIASTLGLGLDTETETESIGG